jgi:SAM-dependent methyltransferase
MHKTLQKIISQSVPPIPWAEGETIPWNDPDFSRRMLREHLSQEHDAASRRTETIAAHIAYIHTLLPAGRSARVLDLGCGPGLYAQRLAGLGHSVHGIDFSPASIEYARKQALHAGFSRPPHRTRTAAGGQPSDRPLRGGRARDARSGEGPGSVEYVHADMREAEFGGGYDLVMLIFGEFNVFQKSDALRILAKIHAALASGSRLLLEPHPFAAVQAIGVKGRRWSANETGLFSDRPYLYLEESFWDPERAASTTRYYIIDAETGELTQHSASMQAYSDAEYRAMLGQAGFVEIEFGESLTGDTAGAHTSLCVITAE